MTVPSLDRAEPRASFARVIEALDAAGCAPKVRGDHADARCPVTTAHAHGDRRPSLSVDWRAGQTLVKCHTGCAAEEVRDALGLTWPDFWDEPRESDRDHPRPPRRRNDASAQKCNRRAADDASADGEASKKRRRKASLGKTVATYTYTDAEGTVVGEVRRFEPKDFRWRRLTASGKWEFGAPEQRPLYRLPAVLAAVAAGEPVWLGEGEKDAEALTSAGVCGSCNPGGAGKWREEHTVALRGARVVIVADRDDAGERHAYAVAAALDGVAADVQIVQAAEGKDAADHLAAGHGLDAFVPLQLAEPEPIEAARAKRRNFKAVRPDGSIEDQPAHHVNVIRGGPFRFSDGDDGFARGLYVERDREWRHCGDLPYVHARAMYWTGVTHEAQYVLSARPDSQQLCIAVEDVDSGRWADMLGVPRSASVDIVIALATAIRQLAARDTVPEFPGAPTRRDRTEDGHLRLPPAAVLPAGYGERAEGVTDDEAAEAWRRIIAIAGRSPLLALVLGASVAAPFVGPLRTQSHWWVLYGDPNMGKTTALSAAGAVWGDPALAEGVVMSWNATGKGLGKALGLLGILPAFLDEAGTAELSRDQWAQLMYQTCQGNRRTVSPTHGAGVIRSAPWFGSLFVTSNGRLAQDLAVGRFAGLARRIVELEAPFTLTAEDGEAVTDASEIGYGWLGSRVIEAFTPEQMAQYRDTAAPTLGPPAVGEAATLARIMSLAVAGAKAADAILGTGTTLTDAATAAAADYMAENLEPREPDGARMLAAFAAELAAHRPAWPTRAAYDELGRSGLASHEESLRAMHGYETKFGGVVDEDAGELYVFPDTWHATADALGVDEAMACRWLHDHGTLLVPPERRRKGNWQSRKRIGAGQVSVYRLRLADVLGASADDEPPDDGDAPDTAELPPADDESAPELPLPAEPAPAAKATEEGGDVHPNEAWADTPRPCIRCGRPARTLVDGQPQHLGPWCAGQSAREGGDRSAVDAPTAPTGTSAPAKPGTPDSDAEAPAQKGSRPKPRRIAQAEALAAARAVMAAGGDAEAMAPKLRVLAALEGGRKDRGGPFAPRRRIEGGALRYPYWRAPMPPITDDARVVGGWAWTRPYDGEVVSLDRSGAWGAAAASVDVVHGDLKRTGALDEYTGRPGYYRTVVHPWHETGMPSPLGHAEPGTELWLPHPTVALLADLDCEGRWPGLAITDSWTGDPCRLREWATGYVGELRKHAIETYGRDSEQYAAIKRAFGQATSLLRGSLTEENRRTWQCKAARPDWRHAIEAQAAAVLWRKADAARKVLPPELAPVGLRNTDELVLPVAALERDEIRGGARPVIELDASGIAYGSFKVKG